MDIGQKTGFFLKKTFQVIIKAVYLGAVQPESGDRGPGAEQGREQRPQQTAV
jgi:hypothetical protein